MRIQLLAFVSFLSLLLVGGNIVAVPHVESVESSEYQNPTLPNETLPEPLTKEINDASLLADLPTIPDPTELEIEGVATSTHYLVPFFSQFSDISAPEWKKVGCGIASLAMLIDFYEPGKVNVDKLLEKGIKTHAYLYDAGWTYAGLIALSNDFGLDGETHDYQNLTLEKAYENFKNDLAEGPLMASVHYTFVSTNPIPHLVVITGSRDGLIYYNDPADGEGNKTLAEETFLGAWKKRYIEIRPVS